MNYSGWEKRFLLDKKIQGGNRLQDKDKRKRLRGTKALRVSWFSSSVIWSSSSDYSGRPVGRGGEEREGVAWQMFGMSILPRKPYKAVSRRLPSTDCCWGPAKVDYGPAQFATAHLWIEGGGKAHYHSLVEEARKAHISNPVSFLFSYAGHIHWGIQYSRFVGAEKKTQKEKRHTCLSCPQKEAQTVQTALHFYYCVIKWTFQIVLGKNFLFSKSPVLLLCQPFFSF